MFNNEVREVLDELRFVDTGDYRPQIIDLGRNHSVTYLQEMCLAKRPSFKDHLPSQIKELYKLRNPRSKFSGEQLDIFYREWLQDHSPLEYGCYVYYPWRNELIHIVGEAEFVELRTARNKYKITAKEQELLRNRSLGIIGLSVGHSVALSMAQERVCGKFKLADFDELELSNLNRIRTGIGNLGLPKTVIAAREIAEIDPFLQVEVVPEGIHPQNIGTFIGEGEDKIDLLVEVCDSLPIKIMARLEARSKRIPVVMDTSDRGMLDVERFDLEPERPILHGMVPGIENLDLKSLGPGEVVNILFQVAGGLSISKRMKASLVELNETISSWPQLASSVNLGGAMTTDVVRKILLGGPVKSDRYYVDFDTIFGSSEAQEAEAGPEPQPLEDDFMHRVMHELQLNPGDSVLSEELAREAVRYAGMAPSAGNSQPWVFYYKDHHIGVFHEAQRGHSFANFKNAFSYQSIGAAIENLRLFLLTKGLQTDIDYFPGKDPGLVALLKFGATTVDNEELKKWSSAIPGRHTYRATGPEVAVTKEELNGLSKAAEGIPGTRVSWITEAPQKKDLGRIVAECRKIDLFNPWGHKDFFQKTLSWSESEAVRKGKGIAVQSLALNPTHTIMLKVLEDFEVVSVLDEIDGGRTFDNLSIFAVEAASAIGLVQCRGSGTGFLEGGRAWERLWLKAADTGWALQPLNAPIALFSRIRNGGANALSDKAFRRLKALSVEFDKIFDRRPEGNLEDVFLFRLFKAPEKEEMKKVRLPFDEIYRS